jgi:hypothetical protein
MKTPRAIAALLFVVLIVAGVAVWFSWGGRTRPVLASNFVQNGTVAVRVDRFEFAWELPGRSSKMPPKWLMRYPLLLKGWARLYRETEQVSDGLVWVLVEATVVSDQPVQPNEIEYRLDYGTYTIGALGESFRTEIGRPYAIGTRFELTDGPVPRALEIQVKGQWLRFPINVR